MPEAPMVRVFPAARVTKPPGLTIFKPCQLRSAPRIGLLAVVTVEVHCAMSAEVGKVSQLPARLSAVLLFCLVLVAACAAGWVRPSTASRPVMANAERSIFQKEWADCPSSELRVGGFKAVMIVEK